MKLLTLAALLAATTLAAAQDAPTPPCTIGGTYCGHTLINQGGDWEDIVYRSMEGLVKNPSEHQEAVALFTCVGETEIRLKDVCYAGCFDQPPTVGGEDRCLEK